ncbi:MAG: AraC family transcriptional regulator [Clostridiales Family XIII bacterium]|nr:AraC family transcriptional regulator [Clostridiales Family XIII bacterium]
MYGESYEIKQEDRAQIEALRAHIESNCAEPVTIARLARFAHMSPTKLKFCFRLVCGSTIHAYVSQSRVEKAKRLIRETEIPLHAIAAMVGYQKPSAFSAAFRKVTGVRPSEYRKTAAEAPAWERARC